MPWQVVKLTQRTSACHPLKVDTIVQFQYRLFVSGKLKVCSAVVALNAVLLMTCVKGPVGDEPVDEVKKVTS